MSAKNKSAMKLIGLVAVIALVFTIAWQTGALEKIQSISAMQEFIEGFGVMGYVIFVLVFMASAVFLLPGAIFPIVGGVAFGPVLGGILSLMGATLGAAAAFLVAKYLARDMIMKKFKGNPIFDKIDKGVEENGVSFLILTRFVPVFPYNVQNYVYGLTSLGFWKFTIVSGITMAPGAMIYAFMAGQIAREGVSMTLVLQFAAAGIILFLLSLVPKIWAKKKGIDMDELKQTS
ncbi:TVP38/TMEM64 family protein [Salisediminibacterium selenitireducens]|uniref:TVP38/TMEM64 family membrane protein n=1 Tax=Bacillus selenitireducens (strain ATCC 700615 / DSM 15326 / MLS10) TaxID=439292 RepID=D6Y1H3_BACIE|nr:TVP38/TMEM64 family protein [Salisediminibacterium selenitireducens]ADI00760.1 SNARE associated Golgi protein-related protein [[Bacillus] selenitireducens MLS10]